MAVNSANSKIIGLLLGLTLILTLLKVSGVVYMSWFLALLPVLIPVITILGLFVFFIVMWTFSLLASFWLMKTETPFRFVGGKTRLFPNIVKYLPNPEEVNNYFEPFCGGGAIFFLYGWKCGRAYLNDVNKPLMCAYHKLAHGHYDKIEGHLHDLL